jgi:hypothetical protein
MRNKFIYGVYQRSVECDTTAAAAASGERRQCSALEEPRVILFPVRR